MSIVQGSLTPLQVLRKVLDGIWNDGLESVEVATADGRTFVYRRHDLPALCNKMIFNV